MELVFIKNENTFTSSKIIAENGEIEHSSVQRLIRENKQVLSQFGKIGFEIRPLSSGQSEKIYLLNEQQATLIITLMRNTNPVKKFKFDLVAEFYKMRKILSERQQLRSKSKAVRNSFTDTLKEHGYCKPGHFIQTTKQMKNALDIICKKDEMNNIELKAITAAELLSEINIEKANASGFQKVNPICVNCSNLIAQAIDNKNQIVRR